MNYINRSRVKNNIVFILLIGLLLNCHHRKTTNEWEEVKIDPEIRKDSTYEKLDMQKELFSILEDERFSNEENK